MDVLPGAQASNDVSWDEIYGVVEGVASPDVNRMKASTDQLKTVLIRPGALARLHEIACNRNVPIVIRQHSTIQFKNESAQTWKSRRFTDSQRVEIKERCMASFDEPDELIAKINVEIIAKIARNDPDAACSLMIPTLLQLVNTNLHIRYASENPHPAATILVKRGLATLSAIVSAFAMQKVGRGIQVMAQITGLLHAEMYSWYSTLSANFATIDASTIMRPQMAEDITIAHLVYQSLSGMAQWLFGRTDRTGKEAQIALEAWFQQFFQNSATQVQSLIESRIAVTSAPLSSDPTSFASVKQLTSQISLMGEFFRRCQELNAALFVKLPAATELILFYWQKVTQAANNLPLIDDSDPDGEPSPTAVYPVAFMTTAMLLFKDSLGQWVPVRKNGAINENILSEKFVKEAITLLVAQLMPLRMSELQRWSNDPEEWVEREDGENDRWQFDIRPCAERVLMTFCNQYKDYVVPHLCDMLSEVCNQPTIGLEKALQKEAVYCAIGRCASRIRDALNFTDFVQVTLMHDSHNESPVFPIIKRRIAWLLGRWVQDQATSPDNAQIWAILTHFLQDRGDGTDGVVRLTAATALKACIDSIDFRIEYLAQHLPVVIVELMRLTGEVESLENKRRVVDSINEVIEHAQARIIPYLNLIASAMPQLWLQAGENWLLKGSLLSTVTKMVEASGEHSIGLSSTFIPLIQESITVGSALDNSGLDLWQAALRDATTIASVSGQPCLADIYPQFLELLRSNADLLGSCVAIAESYFLLGAPGVYQFPGLPTFKALAEALENGPPVVNVTQLLRAINLLLQLAPGSSWAEAMHLSGLFKYIIQTITAEKMTTLVLLEHIHVLARIAVVDQQAFLNLMAATAADTNQPESVLWADVLEHWITKFDNMAQPRHRKLSAMALGSLVATGRPEVLERLGGEIFAIWSDVFIEIQERKNEETGSSDSRSGTPASLRYWHNDEPPADFIQDSSGTVEYTRRRAIWDQDVIRTTSLATYVAESLRRAGIACGGQQVLEQKYLGQVDETTYNQIKKELTGLY